MAGPTTPHTQNHSDVSADAIDMQVAENPTTWDKGKDPGLDGDTDGAQTAGTRSFHANQSSGLPQSVAEGTADIGANDVPLPTDGGHGASNASGQEERKQQQHVVGK